MPRLTRSELERYLDKRVEVILFDGRSIRGTMKLGNAWEKVPKLYHILEEHRTFRLTHVKSIRRLKDYE